MNPNQREGVANPQNIAQNNVFQAPNNAGNQAQNNARNNADNKKGIWINKRIFNPNKRSDMEFLMAFKEVFIDEESRKKDYFNNLDTIDEDKLYLIQKK